MKKSSVALAVIAAGLLTCSMSVYAAGAHSKKAVKSSAYTFSLTGMYLQPYASNLKYAVYSKPTPGNIKNGSVDPGYTFAYDLGLQYNFADKLDAISLNWLHFHSTDSKSVSASGSSSVAPPYFKPPVTQALFNTAATGKTEFTLNNAALVVSHLFNIDNDIQLKPFIGLGAAYLKQYQTATYTGENSSDNAYTVKAYNTSKYGGIGPRLGLNAAAFIMQNHLSIIANLGADLLVGSMNTTTNFNSQGQSNPVAVNTSMANLSETRVVPELDSKLGLSYAFTFRSGSSLAVQAGYMYDVYLNGINEAVPTALVPGQLGNGVIAIEASEQNQSNFDLNGPYVNLLYKF